MDGRLGPTHPGAASSSPQFILFGARAGSVVGLLVIQFRCSKKLPTLTKPGRQQAKAALHKQAPSKSLKEMEPKTRVQPGGGDNPALGSNKKQKKIRVLLMHGLKNVERGRLQKMLEEEFEVLSPQMNISLHTNWATNPVLREALAVVTGYVVLITTVLALMHYEGWWYETESAVGGGVVLLFSTVIFLRLVRGQYQDVVTQTVESAMEIMEEAIETFMPDAVVAEDFGGAVAVNMLTQRSWQGPTVLVSSAHFVVADHSGTERSTLALPEEVPVVVLQGGQDKLTPLAHAKRLAATGSEELVQVVWEAFISDGHKLESLTAAKLCELVRTVVVMGLLQAQFREQVGGEQIYFTEAPPELRVSPRKAPQLTSPGILDEDGSPRKAPALVSPKNSFTNKGGFRSGNMYETANSSVRAEAELLSARTDANSEEDGDVGGEVMQTVRESAELLDSEAESGAEGRDGLRQRPQTDQKGEM